eukprot:comp19891_c0_seq1/m.24091 comp19891_c0_seq1/g.24091  ORF comp19891_c0_seq1/g.24091 comp19891_c0_seq1/m.24091 type:complete len:873 (-) comp19891_c0_seq1:315-2933(-)
MAQDEQTGLGLRTTAGESLTTRPPVFTKDANFFFLCTGTQVRVHSRATGECVRKLLGHTATVTGVALNPANSLQVYSFGVDGTVRLWDYVDGILLRTLEVGLSIQYLSVLPQHPDQAMVLTESSSSVTKDGSTIDKTRIYVRRIWLKSPKEQGIKSVKVVRVKGTVCGWAMEPSGSRLVVAAGRSIYLVPLVDGKPTMCYSHPKGRLTCIAHHPTSSYVATGDVQGRITLWYGLGEDQDMAPTTQTLHWHAHPVAGLHFTGDGEYLVSGGLEAVLVVWQLKSHAKQFLPRLGAPIVSVVVSPDDLHYVTAHTDNALRIINVRTFQVERELRGLVMAGGRFGLSRVAVHPTQGTCCLPAQSSQLQMYDLLSDRHVADLAVGPHMYVARKEGTEASTIHVDHVAYAADGQALVTGERKVSPEGRVEVRVRFWAYSPDQQRYIQTTCADAAHSKPLTSVSASSREGVAASTSLDGTFKLWVFNDTKEGSSWWDCAATGTFRSLPATASDFSHDGSLLAVAFEQTVTLWAPSTGALAGTLNQGNQAGSVTSLVFVPGTAYLAAATQNTVTVWNLLTGSAWWSLPVHSSHIAAHPSQGTLALCLPHASGGTQIVVVEASGPKVVALGGEEGPVEGLGYVRDTMVVATGGTFAVYVEEAEEVKEEGKVDGKAEVRGDVYAALFGPVGRKPASSVLLPDTKQAGPGSLQPSAEVFAAPSHVLPPVSTLYDVYMDALFRGMLRTERKRADGADDSDDEQPKTVTPSVANGPAKGVKGAAVSGINEPIGEAQLDGLVDVFAAQLGLNLGPSTPKSPHRPARPKASPAPTANGVASPAAKKVQKNIVEMDEDSDDSPPPIEITAKSPKSPRATGRQKMRKIA